jgi:hypothetical protein
MKMVERIRAIHADVAKAVSDESAPSVARGLARRTDQACAAIMAGFRSRGLR